ncbi:hypothetical protein NEF87_002775 [Candidatus Lokiarchaeum ossiferum]|uniref:Uncharacterized protein n=1 Tax=Candidatus Lokiarchaeum ossiferum TaxID=2951803 RepID=A0ABY6HSU7_9ARCH|nr:hypothetical protein NEF87_002775 [Candidatus Lokiarchaeum sp. B-35]
MTKTNLSKSKTMIRVLGTLVVFMTLFGEMSGVLAAYQPPEEPPEVNFNAASSVEAGKTFSATVAIQNYPGSSYGNVQRYESGTWRNVKSVSFSSSYMTISGIPSHTFQGSASYRLKYRHNGRWIYSNSDSVNAYFGRIMYVDGIAWTKEVRDLWGCFDYYATDASKVDWTVSGNEIRVEQVSYSGRTFGMSTNFVAQSTSVKISVDERSTCYPGYALTPAVRVYKSNWGYPIVNNEHPIIDKEYFTQSSNYVYSEKILSGLTVGETYNIYLCYQDTHGYVDFTMYFKNIVIDTTP